MADPFDMIRDALHAKARKVMDEIGAEAVAHVQQKISTQGPPRSTPGHPPHQDQGRLHDGVSHAQTVLSDRIRETIRSSRTPRSAVPELLHTGTPRMEPRPYMPKSAEEIKATIAGNVAAKMKA